jgi:hypothetical protein
VTDAEHAERVARIQAERARAGRPPTIQSPSVYLLIGAVLEANERTKPENAT